MKLYIAGPMTGIEEYNYPAFHKAEEQLKFLGLGIRVESPARNFNGDFSLPYEIYAQAAFVQVLRSNAAVVLDGWERSRGARCEVALMQWINRPVWRLESFLSLPHKHLRMWKEDTWRDGPHVRVKTAIAPESANFFHAGHSI